MATVDPDVLESMANLSLWLKVRSGDALSLSDVPEIIPLRWTYFRDTWPKLKIILSRKASQSADPDYFRSVLNDLDSFIAQERLFEGGNNPFSRGEVVYRFYPIFEAVLVEQVSLSNEESEMLSKKRSTVELFSKHDFLKIKQDLISHRDYLADTVGLSDPDYNRVYHRGSVKVQAAPSIADLNMMKMVNDQIGSVDFILANLFAVNATVDPFALARLNANNPDVEIGQYSSGRLVKLHFGEDLQDLATRYLNDPNKWIDIAIANQLREPYIDEIGEQLFFLSNGRGNQINVNAVNPNGELTRNKVYLNQMVFIQSNTIPFPSQRLITDIKEVPLSGEIILTLSGDADLDSYRLIDQASIRIFKPNTVNSSQFVLIPSSEPLGNDRNDEIPWFQANDPADLQKTKIDIAIGDSGEMLLTSNGDMSLSYGLANAIQATKLKLMTEQGTNRYHPEYGLVNVVGTRKTSDRDVKNALTASVTAQIQADPRFDRIESLSVQRHQSDAVAYSIDLVVRLTGSNTLVPISFTVAA